MAVQVWYRWLESPGHEMDGAGGRRHEPGPENSRTPDIARGTGRNGPLLLERQGPDRAQGRGPVIGADRRRRRRLRPQRPRPLPAGHLLRQRPVLQVPGAGQRPAGQVVHDAAGRENMVVSAADELPELPPIGRGCPTLGAIAEIADRCAGHRRRAGRAVGRHRARAAWESPRCSSTTRASRAASWCCRPTSSSARSRTRRPAPAASASAAMLAEAVAADPHVTVWPDSTVLYRLLRPQGGRPAQGPAAYDSLVSPKVVLNAAGAREKSLRLSRQPPDRGLRRRRLPDPGQPRPGAPLQPAVHRRRRQRRADRRLPRPAGRHHRGRPGRGPARRAAATRCTPTS